MSEEFHLGNEIKKELKKQERTVAWFARKICCTRTHVYRIFEKNNLDVSLLIKISQVLSHDFLKDLSENNLKNY